MAISPPEEPPVGMVDNIVFSTFCFFQVPVKPLTSSSALLGYARKIISSCAFWSRPAEELATSPELNSVSDCPEGILLKEIV